MSDSLTLNGVEYVPASEVARLTARLQDVAARQRERDEAIVRSFVVMRGDLFATIADKVRATPLVTEGERP